jgi:small ligand-binding sensory domain FIST
MVFAAAVSTAGAEAAGQELAEQAGAALGSGVDLALLFVGGRLAAEAERVATAVRAALAPGALVGCTCEGVIGGDREIEGEAGGATLLAARLPGVTLRPFHVGYEEWQGLLDEEERLQQRVGTGEEHRAQVLLGDPFTTPVDTLLPALDRVFPGCPTVGGMASAGHRPGTNRMLLDDQVFPHGAVGVGLGGALRVETVVSQGCRPIGRPLVVTRAEENILFELGRRPALPVLEELIAELSPEDRELLQNGLFVGIVIDEYKQSFDRGDFLVRGLVGADRESEALAVGDVVLPGQSIQFQVRDAATAGEDLRLLLDPHRLAGSSPAGGLIFSCNGRGRRMFPELHHDVRAVLDALPGTPLAGFFAAGELGPIGGRCFIHGHTASIALFRPA